MVNYFSKNYTGKYQVLPDDLMKTCKLWKADLTFSMGFQISRCYGSSKAIRSSLIGFCDGSTKAYAAVIYEKLERYPLRVLVVKLELLPLVVNTHYHVWNLWWQIHSTTFGTLVVNTHYHVWNLWW